MFRAKIAKTTANVSDEVFAERGRFEVQFLANYNSLNCNNLQGEHCDLKFCLVDLSNGVNTEKSKGLRRH